MGKILDFLFGKGPNIFTRTGEVQHNHPKKKWDDWNNRYQLGSEYNWRNHVGMKAGAQSKDTRQN
jgi:hypothetical protein